MPSIRTKRILATTISGLGSAIAGGIEATESKRRRRMAEKIAEEERERQARAEARDVELQPFRRTQLEQATASGEIGLRGARTKRGEEVASMIDVKAPSVPGLFESVYTEIRPNFGEGVAGDTEATLEAVRMMQEQFMGKKTAQTEAERKAAMERERLDIDWARLAQQRKDEPIPSVKVPVKARQDIQTIEDAENQVQQLKEAYEKISPGESGITARGVGFLKQAMAKLGYDPDVTTYARFKSGIAASIGRGISKEVGNPTNEDINRILGLTPDPTTTGAEAGPMFDEIFRLLDERKRTLMTEYPELAAIKAAAAPFAAQPPAAPPVQPDRDPLRLFGPVQ